MTATMQEQSWVRSPGEGWASRLLVPEMWATVSIVAGQTVGGVVFDLVGLGPAGRRGLTASRAIGAGIALVAVIWTVSSEIG